MARSLRTPGHRALMQVLIETRKEAGITQQELADRLNRPQSYVAKVETGERRLDVIEFIEWAEGIGASPALLMDRVAKAVPGQ
ncbi:helix-turn-helix domain-containing protein [Pseudogemmobacter humi]|uniref:Helix-turn-helix protein n=1 Tax=Pseudogemmobacter humi TaxID=2483812 RepID=A0A3P5XCN5_9RHOB|nr:helix-turn-helix transcriptional regulator [Pseudogemmobacter humi]VDC28603.1 helix-turn-helix protein [Pseudogemmobacter humi]